ncbi:hypothetical protein SAMD00023353_4000960 [Rosellinia necatrix]|uniref:Uncharacterized protein n=1 Tax=Rosellinia necatrix TaxID=77044 RepID=A0A1S8A959_ROSNE|nr:hypothetical protein SAMD00023353_4000960 [Rosellinia necatrix]
MSSQVQSIGLGSAVFSNSAGRRRRSGPASSLAPYTGAIDAFAFARKIQVAGGGH